MKNSETYSVIADEAELDKFIEWLPNCSTSEQYYVAFFARSKYDHTGVVKSDKAQLKSFTSTKSRLKQKLMQLECRYGAYLDGNNPIPQHSLAVYISVNPRSLEKAAREISKELSDRVFKPYDGYNPHKVSLSMIQKTSSKKTFSVFDMDGFSIDDVKELMTDSINPDAVDILKTRGGCHVYIKHSAVLPEFKNKWYKMFKTHADPNQDPDCMSPIAGTFQGGHIPTLHKGV